MRASSTHHNWIFTLGDNRVFLRIGLALGVAQVFLRIWVG